MKPQFTIWFLPVLPGWEDSKGPGIKNHQFPGIRVTPHINNSLNSFSIDIPDYVFKVNLKQYLEFYSTFLLCWVFIAVRAFFWLLWRGTTLQLWCKGSAVEHGLQGVWSSLSVAPSTGSLFVVQGFVPQRVRSSRIRDWTHVPCLGRQILHYWATSEALSSFIPV